MATIPAARLKDIPALARDNSNLAAVMDAVREAMQTFRGYRGDPLDQALTLRGAMSKGVLLNGLSAMPGTGGLVGPGSPNWPITAEPDLTPPPTATGLTVTAGISYLYVHCDSPVYTQGHGHDRSVVYGAKWPTTEPTAPTFSDAVELFEFQGTFSAYPSDPSTRWCIWLKWKSNDGILSTSPAGGTNGVSVTTGQDVSLLLTALTGQITASQLYADLGSRIDLIDGGVAQPALPYPLAKIAAMQDGLNQKVRTDLNETASNLLQSVVTISQTLQTVHDAGVYTDPGTGTVKIYGLEAANDHLNTVDIRLNAHDGTIALKASTTYVDGAIAAATLTPADLLLFDGMSARIGAAEVDINSLEGAVNLKAAVTDLTETNARMTTAETNISAAQGAITSKVSTADFTTVTGGLDTRVGTAETVITALGDTSAISSMVMQGSRKLRDDAENSKTMLLALLNGETQATQQKETLAFAREELTAYTDAGILSEASKRLELVVTVNSNLATLVQDYYTKVTADSAISNATTELASTVAGNQATALTGYYTKAGTDGVISSSVSQVQARLDTGDYAAVKVESSASASAVTGLNAQYTIKQDAAGLVSGYGLATTANNAAPRSAFGVRTNQFYVAPPATASATAPTLNLYDGYCWLDTSVTPNVTRYRSGEVWTTASPMLPFVVQTTPTTINGVAVPAGVYANDLYVKNGTITNLKVANGAIDDAKIANLAVSTAKIADAAITTAKIGTAQITTALINLAAITTALIADANITRAKIGNAAIGSAQIEDATITNAKIGAAAITTAKIADANITTAKIGAAQITSALIADANITSAKIGDAQITTLKIGADQVTIPASANGGAFTVPLPAGTEVSCVSVGMTSTGAPIFLTWGISTDDPLGVATRLYRNGSQIADFKNANGCYKDVPGAGSHTYEIRARFWLYRSAPHPGYNSTLMCLETKR